MKDNVFLCDMSLDIMDQVKEHGIEPITGSIIVWAYDIGTDKRVVRYIDKPNENLLLAIEQNGINVIYV